MSGDKIQYSSEAFSVFAHTDIIETKTINGLTCIWKGRVIGRGQPIKYSWQFNWNGMLDDVESFAGHIQFLSFHSDYFTALFSSNYKEGQMDEIPIEDVSFEDFGLLLSTIYPASVFPTDKTVEKFLELADRFLMQSVIRHAEHHLLHISGIQHEKIILLADRYKMKKLLEKSIREIGNIETVKELKKTAEYNQISNDTKAMILDNIST